MYFAILHHNASDPGTRSSSFPTIGAARRRARSFIVKRFQAGAYATLFENRNVPGFGVSPVYAGRVALVTL